MSRPPPGYGLDEDFERGEESVNPRYKGNLRKDDEVEDDQEFERGAETNNPRYKPSDSGTGNSNRYVGLEPPRTATADTSAVPIARIIGEAPMEWIRKTASYMTERSKSSRAFINRAGSFAFYDFQSSKEYTPWFTRFMVVANIIVFGMELYVMNRDFGTYFVDSSQNPTFGPNVETLIAMGAKRADLIVGGEYWRLITPMFLHGGVLHLVFNMLFLYQFGSQLESIFGTPIVAYIYLVSGYVGVLFSCLLAPTIVGVGASGACYGLFGAAWADFILNYSLNQRPISEGLKLLFATVLNFVIGLMPYLDNFAHIGGFITGFITGLSTMTLSRYTRDHRLKPKKNYQLVLQALGMITAPILIVVMTSTLFLGIDVQAFCSWCQYLTCVPFPPGDSPWWTCNPCEEGTSWDPADPSVLECPRGVGAVPMGNSSAPTSTAELLDLCAQLCGF